MDFKSFFSGRCLFQTSSRVFLFFLSFFSFSVFLAERYFVISTGAIELSILADYYGREIAAYDIQTTRCDLYGQVSLVVSFHAYQSCQLSTTECLRFFISVDRRRTIRKGLC